MSLLIVGSVALDTIKTPLGKCRNVLGGSATFSSVSARFFSPVKLVAVVGKDFPRAHISFLKERGIDVEGVTIQKGKTFRWHGAYGWDFSDPETLATHLGVFAHFDPALPKSYANSKYVFLANIDPDIQSRVLAQLERPRLVVSDTMNFWITHKKKALLKVLKKVDVCLLNESEARQLSGEANLIKAARAIIAYGPKRLVIKKGEHGALLFSGNVVFCIPAYLLETVFDPTGAGDTFAGAFCGYLASCKSITDNALRRALLFGTIMATFAVESFSLKRLGTITKADITRRVKAFKKQMCF